MPDNLFSEIGFEYIGPVDGHNVKQLETVIRWAKDLREPVIVHVLTEKGRGCTYAQERPEVYHGVGPFDPKTGTIKPTGESFSDRFGQCLTALAREDLRITAITAAMASGTGLDEFAKEIPERFFDVGIAEGNAAAQAAGMASQGLLPVFAVYSSFLQRSFDMLIHDVSLQQLHVVFCVDRAGLVGSDGETHHGIFDVGYLSEVPGMTILCPANFGELERMLRQALYEVEGPVAVRYPRGGEGEFRSVTEGEAVCLCPGSDITLVGYGTMINEVLAAAEKLKIEGVSAEVRDGVIAVSGEGESVQKLRFALIHYFNEDQFVY